MGWRLQVGRWWNARAWTCVLHMCAAHVCSTAALKGVDMFARLHVDKSSSLCELYEVGGSRLGHLQRLQRLQRPTSEERTACLEPQTVQGMSPS